MAQPPKPNQDSVEMWSLRACAISLTDWLATSGGDETQTDGLERLKRVAVTRAAARRFAQIGDGIPFALTQSVMANELRR